MFCPTITFKVMLYKKELSSMHKLYTISLGIKIIDLQALQHIVQ